MNAAISAAWQDTKDELLKLASETTRDAKVKLEEFAKIGEAILLDVATGMLDEADALKAKDDLVLAARSALVNAGYDAQARALDGLKAGLATAIKVGILLA